MPYPLLARGVRAVAVGRGQALVPGRCNSHTQVRVRVLPIPSGLGSDPSPGT